MSNTPIIGNSDMRTWFLKIYRNSIKSPTGIAVPEKVYDYLVEKGLVTASPDFCTLSDLGFRSVRQLFTSDELRGKIAKPEAKSTVSSAPRLL